MSKRIKASDHASFGAAWEVVSARAGTAPERVDGDLLNPHTGGPLVWRAGVIDLVDDLED